jgi:glycosyltransferase involved in cell wall biosynthesis
MSWEQTKSGSQGRNTFSSVPATVSVVVPMRNEEAHLGACLASLLDQTYPAAGYEIILVDGGSRDGSKEVVRRMQREHGNILLLENPAGIVPTAMNLGIAAANGEFIVRADAHSTYPRHYLETCVRYLQDRGIDNVGGPIVTVAADNSLSARLVAAVLSNPFGVGNSRFRTSLKEGFVDTVPFGAFRKDLFARVGAYDEQLGRNEDNDLNARIRQAGGKIFLTPALTLNYFPAARFSQLLKQTYRSSEWHLFSLLRSRSSMSARHLLPAAFLLGLCALGGLAFITSLAWFALAGVLGIYLLAALGFTLQGSGKMSLGLVVLMPLAFLAFHLTYAIGILAGTRFLFRRPSPRPTR